MARLISALSDRTARVPVGTPQSSRSASAVSGHWLLARLGKRVLRPGGAELSRRLIQTVQPGGRDVIELAPGLGHTAREILAHGPGSYLGVDQDPDALTLLEAIVAGYHGSTLLADAADTGLPASSADIVVGEAMLTMQSPASKAAIITEAHRLLRPGGRYAIHELALTPDALDTAVKTEIQQALARSIKVNARPLTVAEWRALLGEHDLIVEQVQTAPMALLQPRRLVADEGIRGAARFLGNVLTQSDARRRVLAMRRTFRRYRHHLTAIAIIASKPAAAEPARASTFDETISAQWDQPADPGPDRG